MSLFALNLPYANWTQRDYRTLIFVLRFRRQMDQGLLIKSQHCCLANVDISRLNSVTEEGETAASAILSTPNRFWKAAVRETRRPTQHTAAAPNLLISHNAGSTLETI